MYLISDDPLAINCFADEWMCEDKSICIQKKDRCNKIVDCLDGSDEKDCNNQCDIYKCQNGKCLDYKSQLCNGVDDCGDNSDEHHCGEKISFNIIMIIF